MIYKDGSSGVVQKAHHDDPEGGVYYTVDLGPGRVINALHKSLRPQDAEQATGAAEDAAATTPRPHDADATLDARFAKREAKVRASFLEATGSLRDYEHAGPDEGPDRTERQRIRARKRRLKRNRRRAGIAAAEALARAPLPAAEAPAPAYAEAPADISRRRRRRAPSGRRRTRPSRRRANDGTNGASPACRRVPIRLPRNQDVRCGDYCRDRYGSASGPRAVMQR